MSLYYDQPLWASLGTKYETRCCFTLDVMLYVYSVNLVGITEDAVRALNSDTENSHGYDSMRLICVIR